MTGLPARTALVAPGTRTDVVTWLTRQGIEVDWAPAPGGVAWWGGIETDQMAVISLPSRIGLIERVPGCVPTVADVQAPWHSLLEGGASTVVWDCGELLDREWTAGPARLALELAQATDFVRRRVDAVAGFTVVGPGPWLGAVPFLGGPHTHRVEPPVPGLPGLGSLLVESAEPTRLMELLHSIDPGSTHRIPASLPRRRLGDLTLRIP